MQQTKGVQATKEIELLRQAFARKPGDLDVGLMLSSALYNAENYSASAVTLRSVLNQHPNHSQSLLMLARAEARASNIPEALKVFGHAQQADPSNPQASQVAAALAAQIRDWPALLRIANIWTESHPNSIDAWQALSRARFEESQFSLAIVAFEAVLRLDPQNAAHMISAARIAIAAGHYEAARSQLSAAQELTPESGELLYTMSRLLHMTGELSEAEAYCRRAIVALPGFAPAYVSLGTLREGRLEEADIKVITHLFNDAGTHPEYRAMLGFTLGDALDSRKEYERAFKAWGSANHISRLISEREGIVYKPELIEEELEWLPQIFAKPLEPYLNPKESKFPRPIFVVGMPRSSTTLVESILASHSSVHGAGELATLYEIHESLMYVARVHGIEAAREMLRKEGNTWRENYLETLPHTSGTTSVVDKQPLNFRSIGLIRLLFPASPIIYTKRSPVDVCLSIFRHKFSKNWPCANRLSDIGHYYGIHERIFTMWQARYTEFIHVIDHATLVSAPETEIRRLLAFASLDFERACLAPHQTKRPIATFSSVQVKNPVSAIYSNRAAPYAAYLSPLHDALLSAGIYSI